MRACTAVVTEMSYNHNNDPSARYRGEIEFIKASDWERDLRASLKELLDDNGEVSRECTNASSDAGIAYAKIKAVYPNKTKEALARATIEELMDQPEVKQVLGTTKMVQRPKPELFYKDLQHYVDSKEKTTGAKKKKKRIEKGEKKPMEYWPLIKVVRIYTKADALSTGAIIVDLPGVHDSSMHPFLILNSHVFREARGCETYFVGFLGSQQDMSCNLLSRVEFFPKKMVTLS